MGIRKPPGGPQVPLPESGERVFGMPSAKSKFNKAPKPMSRAEQRASSKARKQRMQWEASDAGQARTANPYAGSSISTGQRYFIDNYDKTDAPGPRVYDAQLPGMADPDAAPRPPKWEELSEEARQHTVRSLAQHGTSIETMSSDFGTQLDQAKHRAESRGYDVPHASLFYEKGSEPRDVLDQSAAELGTSPLHHAQLNAFTSPNTKFAQDTSRGRRYPNNEAAVHAQRWVNQGGHPDDITNELSATGTGIKRAQGYLTNIKKAASAAWQSRRGVAPADWTSSSGTDMFSNSPKTGPYANSWSDTHPQYTVSDVHTGGGGFLSHLSSFKGTAGNKSEREQAIASIPLFHAAADYAARQAMKERNLSSVRRSQATQWGEEQLQRGEAGMRGGPSVEDVYPSKPLSPQFSTHSDELFHNYGGRETTNPEVSPRDTRSATTKQLGLPF